MKLTRVICLVDFCCCVLASAAQAAAPDCHSRGPTPEIFKQFSEHVVKIEVVETGSSAKASIGTGFFANGDGQIVTNYHVISKLIHSPDRYRIDVTGVCRTNEHRQE